MAGFSGIRLDWEVDGTMWRLYHRPQGARGSLLESVTGWGQGRYHARRWQAIVNLRFGRMPANAYPIASRVDNCIIVHLQCHYRDTSAGGQTPDVEASFIPGEIIPPNLPAWMKQRSHNASQRVEQFDQGALVQITTIAGKTKVIECGLATSAAWNYVINNQRV